METLINNKDEMIMSLVHYFVTEEDYTPINVQGAKNEIWLENLKGPYKIVRINSKYIHNTEQYKMDLFKMHYVIKQIKRKTLSFKMNVLNICLDIGNSVELENDNSKYINTINVTSISDIKKDKTLGDIFPKIKTNNFKRNRNLEEVIHATEDINKKTESENMKYENVFKPKKIVFTKVVIGLCILMYLITLGYGYYLNKKGFAYGYNTALVMLGANNLALFKAGEYYRILASIFLHGSLWHLIINMYSLWIIGSQVENFVGKYKFLAIYLLSGLMGNLLSLVFLGNNIAIGASGAIFGLMGCLLYFGYHYRLYLSSALTNQIIPIILLNLFLGFAISGIDNAAHIGGLIGGYLSTMIVGLKYKSTKQETINGIIVYLLLISFIIYVIFNLI